MATNDTNNIISTCSITIYRLYIIDQLRIGVYHVLTILYLIIGISTSLILLAAFYKQSRTERAYRYQIVFTLSKLFETYAFGSFLLADKWFQDEEVRWFVTDYRSMYVFISFGLGLHHTFIISSLLLSIAMAADRVLALRKPMVYKSINHTKHQLIASVVCFALGFLAAGPLFVSKSIVKSGDRFVEIYNYAIDATIIGSLCFYLRLVLRAGGVVLLVILNVVMFNFFRQRMRKVATMTNNSPQDEEKRSRDKMLLWLNIYQACIMLANQVPHVSWQVLIFFLTGGFANCEGRLVGALCDAVLMLTDTADFFIVIAIKKKMRKLVVNALPKCCFSQNLNVI